MIVKILLILLKTACIYCLYVRSVQKREEFSTGIVSEQCLRCICEKESGCTAMGCQSDGNSDACGYFQIKYDYWVECGKPGTSWQACADDLMCSSSCVQKYMDRYARFYNCSLTCESYAREHNGGQQGCHHASTLDYWHDIQKHGCQ